jgi:spore coat polysaccharide biosynthesis protein SpsF
MSSSRLRGKAMLDLCGKSILERVLERTKASSTINDIWIATSYEAPDKILELVGTRNNVNVFRGDLCNVLGRFCRVVSQSKADIIIRITADNPFTEARFIDLGVDMLRSCKLDYVGFKNIPKGSGVEVISSDALFYSDSHTDNKEDREHVTRFVLKHPDIFRVRFVGSPIDVLQRPDINVSIDTLEQYVRLYRALYHLLEMGKSDIKLEDLICSLDRME